MNLTDFFLGAAAGVLANQAFAVLSRGLPASWVRYSATIGRARKEKSLASIAWSVDVRISWPIWWRRILNQTLSEYLVAELRFDDGEWVAAKWDRGDAAESLLLANGAMRVSTIVLTSFGEQREVYLSDHAGESQWVATESGTISLRIVRTVDTTIAAQREFTFKMKDGEVSLV